MEHEELVRLHRRWWAAKQEMLAAHREMREKLDWWLKTSGSPMESHDIIELLSLQARYFQDKEEER